jgi:hypothetical protein
MKRPALLTSVSTRPNLLSASPITRSAVSASAMSPWTLTMSGSSDGAIEREFATTP